MIPENTDNIDATKSNKQTSNLQTCVSELESVSDYVGQLMFSDKKNNEEFLKLINSKVDFVLITLNEILSNDNLIDNTKQFKMEKKELQIKVIQELKKMGLIKTNKIQESEEIKETEEIDEADNASVKISIDNVVKDPTVVKKLDDKNIDVDLTDREGKSLVKEMAFRKKLIRELKRNGIIK